ncbi:MAG: hypothetical protein V2G33_06540 [bacterium JZ-2024 1]
MRYKRFAYFPIFLGSVVFFGGVSGGKDFESSDPEVKRLSLLTQSNLRTLEKAVSIIVEVESNAPRSLEEALTKDYLPFRREWLINPYTEQPVKEVPDSVFQSLLQNRVYPVYPPEMEAKISQVGLSHFIAPAPENVGEIYGNLSVLTSPPGGIVAYWDPNGKREFVYVRWISDVWYMTLPEDATALPYSKEELYDPWQIKKERGRHHYVVTYKKWFSLVTRPEERQLVVICSELKFALIEYLHLMKKEGKVISSETYLRVPPNNRLEAFRQVDDSLIKFLPENWLEPIKKVQEAGKINLTGLKNPFTGTPLKVVPFSSRSRGDITLYDSIESLLNPPKPIGPFSQCIAYGEDGKIVYPHYLGQLNLKYNILVHEMGLTPNQPEELRKLWVKIFEEGRTRPPFD